MQRKFAAFDIDWTLHNSALGVEFLFELSRKGLLENRLLESKYEAWREAENRGEYFKEQFMEIYDTGMRGLSKVDMEHVSKSLAGKVEETVFEELRHEIKQSKQEGKLLIAISQSPAITVLPLGELLGFDICTCPEFEYDEQGIYLQPYHRSNDEKNKGLILKRLANEHTLSFTGSSAYGDSLDDLPMLELVEYPVAVNPSAELRIIAEKHNWRIITASVQ